MRMLKHPSRDALTKRLKRAEGHLHSVIEMLSDTRSSISIVQQMQAIECALAAAKRQLIHDQMQHCIDQRDMTGGALRELKDLAKFL
jgi:DNA-binding FrmR family transcriptional regulator